MTTAPTAPTTAPPPILFNYQYSPANVLLADTQRLQASSQVYFGQTLPKGTAHLSDNHPTPEGYASSLGFAGFTHLRSSLNNISQAELPKYRPSIETIAAGCSHIQDYYIKHSLSNDISALMVKFLSSAYFNINETKQAQIDSRSSSTKEIRIVVESSQPSTVEEAIEIERLNTFLDEQSQAELSQMGKVTTSTPTTDVVSLEDIL